MNYKRGDYVVVELGESNKWLAIVHCKSKDSEGEYYCLKDAVTRKVDKNMEYYGGYGSAMRKATKTEVREMTAQ